MSGPSPIEGCECAVQHLKNPFSRTMRHEPRANHRCSHEGNEHKGDMQKEKHTSNDYCKTTDQYRDMKDAHAWSSCVPSNSSHHLTEESGNCLFIGNWWEPPHIYSTCMPCSLQAITYRSSLKACPECNKASTIF
jgi:hypothetical protein